MSGVIGPVKRATADRLVKAGTAISELAPALPGESERTRASSVALANPSGRDAGQERDITRRKHVDDPLAWAPAAKEAQ
jgi:hypothetical protein